MKNITFAFQDTNQKTFIPTDGKNMKKHVEEEEKKEVYGMENDVGQISYVLDNLVIFTVAQCQNTTCSFVMKEEEIMTGWQKSMNEYVSQCPKCKAKFVPKLQIFTDSDHEILNGKEGVEIQWLPPSCLMKEFTNCITQRGENILLKEDFRKDHRTTFWNLVFYFKLFKLPYFFLDESTNSTMIREKVENLGDYQPVESKKRPSKSSLKKSGLNKDALQKLNEANKDQNFGDAFARTANRPPSLYEGMMGGGGGFGSDSLGIDT